MNPNSPIVVGLDIGTTKVVAIAGIKNEQDKIEIIGFGKSESKGVEHGLVLNIDQCITSIKEAIDLCIESNPNLEINNVYVGIAGQHVKSIQNRGERIRTDINDLISKIEIDMLINDQKKTYLPPGDRIIEIVPQDFTVDDKKNILHPIGMRGTKIGANFHIITGDKNAIHNINMCVKKANLSTAELVLQPLASAAAVMSEEELEMGVAIVDIGGGTTDMAIFKEGILHHTQVIPFAGVNISNDIKTSLGVLRAQAESLKVKYGSALESEKHKNHFITIPGIKGHPAKEISYNSLARIIQARIQEIMMTVTNQIEMIGLSKKLHGGIILTGGGSHLANIKLLTEFITKMNVRIGYPDEHLALTEQYAELRNPMYATCIGLVLKGFNDLDSGSSPFHEVSMVNKVYQGNNEDIFEPQDLLDYEPEFLDIQNEPEEISHPLASSFPVVEENTADETEEQFSEEAHKEKSDSFITKRKSSIGNIFKTFKTKLIDIFEEDDEVAFPED